MNGLGVSILLVALLAVLVLPKRWALVGMTIGIIYLTQAQRLDIAGFNLYAARIVELAGFLRVVLRRELRFSMLNRIDLTLVIFHLYTLTVFLLRSNESKSYEIGVALDAFLAYFAFRGLIEGVESFRWFLRVLVVLLVPYAVLVSIETLTFYNPFTPIGGIEMAAAGDMWVREGRLRAVGSFGHPSLMGTLGGAFLPLYMGLWFVRNDRLPALVGIGVSLALVWASNSGGPVTCVAAAVLGWSLWTMRASMRSVRRGLAIALVLLAAVMKAPIWYLLARLSTATGGDGWHRAELLDAAFRNLDKWWLAGMPTLDTATWLPYTNTNTGAVDMTNHLLVFGITAGMGSVILGVVLLKRSFSHIGHALRRLRSANQTAKDVEYLYWGLGVMLWVHVANWFSIAYWDQINLVWFMHLAMISGLTQEVLRDASGTSQPSRPAFRRHSPAYAPPSAASGDKNRSGER